MVAESVVIICLDLKKQEEGKSGSSNVAQRAPEFPLIFSIRYFFEMAVSRCSPATPFTAFTIQTLYKKLWQHPIKSHLGKHNV